MYHYDQIDSALQATASFVVVSLFTSIPIKETTHFIFLKYNIKKVSNWRRFKVKKIQRHCVERL